MLRSIALSRASLAVSPGAIRCSWSASRAHSVRFFSSPTAGQQPIEPRSGVKAKVIPPKGMRKFWSFSRDTVASLASKDRPFVMFVNPQPKHFTTKQIIIRSVFFVKHNLSIYWAMYKLRKQWTPQQTSAFKRASLDLLRIISFSAMVIAGGNPIAYSFTHAISSLVITLLLLVPRPFMAPSSSDLTAFVEYTFSEHDPQKTGFVDIELAKNLMRFLNTFPYEGTIDKAITKAGKSPDGRKVRYANLDMRIANSSGLASIVPK